MNYHNVSCAIMCIIEKECVLSHRLTVLSQRSRDGRGRQADKVTQISRSLTNVRVVNQCENLELNPSNEW